MIYTRFELDTQTQENLRKINSVKAGALERELAYEKLVVFASSTGTNGAPNHMIVGGASKKNAAYVFDTIAIGLDLPYKRMESYSVSSSS